MNKLRIFLIISAIIISLILILYVIWFTSLVYKHPSGHAGRDLFNYRLGDVVEFEQFYNDTKTKLIYKYYFRNTIASEYLKRIKDSKKKPNYDILYQIVKEKSNDQEIPKDNELIIHLRIGDVIDWEYSDNIDDLLEGKKNYYYLRNYEYYDKIFKKIITLDIEKIILVGGYHTKEDHSRSEEYVAKLKKYMEKNNFKVETRIAKGSGDEDFIYMSNGKYFLKSGGRYSSLVNRMVKMNNGIILEEKDD